MEEKRREKRRSKFVEESFFFTQKINLIKKIKNKILKKKIKEIEIFNLYWSHKREVLIYDEELKKEISSFKRVFVGIRIFISWNKIMERTSRKTILFAHTTADVSACERDSVNRR